MTKNPSHVNVPGPLKPFAAGFVEWLARHGYTRLSATFQLNLMAHWDRWLTAKRRDLGRLSMTEVEQFLTARRRAGYTQYLSAKAMAPMLASLCEQGVVVMPRPAVPPAPVDAVLARYREYLLQERGLGYATARGYVDAVRPFVRERVRPDGVTLPWASLDAAAVMAFVVRHTPNQSRGTAKLTVAALRSLLGFLHVDGLITRSLTAAVPSVAGWRLAGIPKALPPAQIHALLASCDRRTRTGRRAFAVLTILVRLGLRAGEVAALRLDDINWRNGTVVIRGKGPHVESLPWPTDVGEAVVAYLRRGRPDTAVDRTVFVRVKAPHRALSSAGLTEIVAAAARRAGLGVIHAHRLRHSAATQLLRAGAPLAEIGQLLRHRRALTTAIYAKVDQAALRTIARPWPGGVA
jgi:site-specific recombinase XerD